MVVGSSEAETSGRAMIEENKESLVKICIMGFYVKSKIEKKTVKEEVAL